MFLALTAGACGVTTEATYPHQDGARGEARDRGGKIWEWLTIPGVGGTGEKKGPAGEAAVLPGSPDPFLWQAMLDVLGERPLLSSDPVGRIIITDWFAPPSEGNMRTKLVARIVTGGDAGGGPSVTMHRQRLEAGIWRDAPSDSAAESRIAQDILARARALRDAARP